jgi:hypothetical protein
MDDEPLILIYIIAGCESSTSSRDSSSTGLRRPLIEARERTASVDELRYRSQVHCRRVGVVLEVPIGLCALSHCSRTVHSLGHSLPLHGYAIL